MVKNPSFFFSSFLKSFIILIENRGEFMYNMYVILFIILWVSLITGCIIQWYEHKQKEKEKDNKGNV